MGMPITTYSVLNALGEGRRDEIRLALKTLQRFSVFAFILHDPDADETSDFGQRNRAIEQKISKNFDYLDHVTGSRLLFFALIDPPDQWLKHAQNRPYYKHLQRNANAFNDRSVTAFSLTQSLGIPYEMLPCLVITPSFSNKSVMWVRTCPDHVEEQLARLGYRSKQSRSIVAVNAFFNDIREEINLCEGSGFTVFERNLAKALVDVVSFIMADDNSDHLLRKRVQKTLEELGRTLSVLKETKNLDIEELDALCMKFVSFASHLNTRGDLNLTDFINVDTTLLEDDSRLILKTAYMVNDLLTRGRLIRGEPESVDYTPVAICLAKVFEKEINLSVVHWIRQQLGIDLPNYFNKYQPKVKAVHNQTSINFNRYQKDRDQIRRWLPPGIGGARLVYGKMVNDINENDWTHPLRQDSFLEDWETIKNIRNAAAHTEIVDRNAVSTVQDAFNSLSENRVFDALSEMKKIGREKGFQ